jgi:hypothetical protein
MSNQPARSKNFYEDLKRLIPIVAERSAEIGIQVLAADMETRIFELGLDYKGQVFKQGQGYSKGYARYRLKKQLQISRIDLEVTSALRRSIVTNKATTGQQIIFNNTELGKIARYLDVMWKPLTEVIFVPSIKESDKVFDIVEEVFSKAINELNTKYQGAV